MKFLSPIKLIYIAIVSALIFVFVPFIAVASNNEYIPSKPGDPLYSYYKNQYGDYYKADTFQLPAKDANNDKPQTTYKPQDPGDVLYSYNNKNYGEYYSPTTYQSPLLKSINGDTPAEYKPQKPGDNLYNFYYGFPKETSNETPYASYKYDTYNHDHYDYKYDSYTYDNTADTVLDWIDYGLSFVGLGL